MTSRNRAVLAAVASDVAAVLVFVLLGRRSHDSGQGLAAILGTAAPFLVALAVGWVVVLALRLAPLDVLTGVVLWAITAVGGLVLRRTAWARGTAPAFIVVTLVAIGLLFVGWRSILGFTRGRGGISSSTPPSKAGL